MSVQPDPAVKDPSTDPTASYALEPAFVRGLTDRIVSTTGRSVPTYCPFNGQPLGTVPQSSAADVAEAFRRARRAQQQWARTSIDERQAAAAAAARPGLRPPVRDHRPDLLGVRQGPQATRTTSRCTSR